MLSALYIIVLLVYLPLHASHKHVWVPLYWVSMGVALAKYLFQLSIFMPSCEWYSIVNQQILIQIMIRDHKEYRFRIFSTPQGTLAVPPMRSGSG